MDLRYKGPHDEVEIPDLGLVVANGDTFTVADKAAAERLLEQSDNYELASPKRRASGD